MKIQHTSDVIGLIDGIFKIKISIIMQVYLGEYPGSGSNSDRKLLRTSKLNTIKGLFCREDKYEQRSR
jgi:hypothetical protein